jgi:hypothetical protein
MERMMLKQQLQIAAFLAAALLSSSEANADGGRHAFAKTCGGSTMVIHCSPSRAECDRNELVIRQGRNPPRSLPLPHGLENYDPVGLACASTPDRHTYFVVEYGDATHTCATCEWHHIYDADGKILTRSDPAFVNDPSLPGGQSSHPDANDFIRVSKQLKLTDTPMAYGN